MSDELCELVKCPLGCDAGDELVMLAPCDAPVGRGPSSFRIIRCQECGLQYLNPRPSAVLLSEYYDRDYYGPDHVRFDAPTERAVAFFVWWRGLILNQLLAPGSRVLDVGCGRGNFLQVMQARGHQVVGTELSQNSAKRAAALFPNDVFVGDLPELPLSDGSFDMITMWHVIEHVPDPLQYIRRSYQLLRPGGVLVLAQPNISSIQAWLGGAKWFHLDVPRHLFHFSPTTLGRMLGVAGFTVERVRQHSVEQNPFGLLQSLLNRAGFRQNVLYKVLKNEVGAEVGPVQRRAMILLYYLAMPCAIVLTEIGSLFGFGGTFYLVARKAA